jgi:hypothetical protein
VRPNSLVSHDAERWSGVRPVHIFEGKDQCVSDGAAIEPMSGFDITDKMECPAIVVFQG